MNIPWYIKARERVDALGMQRNQFADRMGVTKGLVSQWFSGATTPPFKRFTKMAEVLDMTVAELLADDEMYAKNAAELDAMRVVREVPAPQHPFLLAALSQVRAVPPAQQAAFLALLATVVRGLQAAPPPPTDPPAP